MGEQVDVFLRDSDAFSWYMERDPGLRSTIVAVVWLDASPDWDTFAAKLERATCAVPLFRMRLVEPPARLSTPRWMVADDFDLTWHLRRVDAPAPHSVASVIPLARTAAMSAFDPAHPLWEFTLVEQLDNGRAALIMKVHHSLTDGIGGMKLALNLFDLSSTPPPLDDTMPEPPTGAPLKRAALSRDSVMHNWHRAADLVRHELRSAGPAALAAARHPLRVASDVLATASSVGRMVAPVATTLSPVMVDRGLGRELDMLTVSLDDLKRAAATAHATVNDVYLAALTGGLRRYHERHSASVDELRVTLPISIRNETDPVAGNRITLQRFTVPVSLDDPRERMREIDVRCHRARVERALPYTNAIAGALNLLPPGVVGGMLKHVDFLASNVPGFTFPVYLAGAKVTGYFPFGPTIGAAVNATLLSYDGTCCVGITIDSAAVRDSELLMTCLAEGFDEVLALGGPHAPPVLPLHDDSAARSMLAGRGAGHPA